MAYVAIQPASTADEAELSALGRERLATYKWPQAVTLRDSLPKTGTGKILKDLLRRGDVGGGVMGSGIVTNTTYRGALSNPTIV